MKHFILFLCLTLIVFHSFKECGTKKTSTRVVHDYTVDTPCIEVIESPDFYSDMGEALFARHFLDEAYSDRNTVMSALRNYQIQMLRYDSLDAGYIDLFTLKHLGLCR